MTESAVLHHAHRPKRDAIARREQNRQASRMYRQKRKQKLALLDQLLEPVTADETADEPPSVEAFDDEGPVDETIVTPSHPLHNGDSPPSTYSQPFIRPLSLLNVTEPHTKSRHLASSTIQTATPSIGYSITETPETPFSDAEVTNALSSIQNLNIAQKRALVRQLQGQMGDVDSVDEQWSSSQGSNWVSTREIPALSSSSTTRMQFEARRFAAFVDRHFGRNASPLTLARIFTAEASFYGAVFTNCYALGMRDVESVMVEDGVSIFSLDPDTGYEPSQLVVIRPRFAGVTPDLRPCDAQLTIGHHPYLDVLPFRDFRSNILRAIAKESPEVDEDQLCRDLTMGGLTCWGAQQNLSGMEAGVPWDARSWEPQVWFLKRYQKYSGGWEGEMWKAARYWHSLRNEKLPRLLG